MKHDSSLTIDVGGLQVGTLRRGRDRDVDSVFLYQEETPESHAASLTMPPRWEPYDWKRGLHPVFDMNLPEGALRAELMRRFSKTTTKFDEFALLSMVGPHQLGRLTIQGESSEKQPTQSIQELLVHDGTHGLFDYLVNTYATYSGVSGVQPKVLVRDESAPDLDRLTHKAATHIVKTWRESEYPELAANEFFCMRAAQLSGLPVPEFNMSANGKFLIIKRFDMVPGGYLGFEDFCSLSGLRTEEKYDGTYEGIAKLVRQFASPEHIAGDLQNLFKMVALSAGVQGGDAHLKNFGMLYPDSSMDAEVRLAPAYDIVSTTPYIPSDSMALLLGGSKAWPKHGALMRFARSACYMPSTMAMEALEQVADGISCALSELIQHQRSNTTFAAVGEAMQSAWGAGVARSLLDPARPVIIDLGAARPSR